MTVTSAHIADRIHAHLAVAGNLVQVVTMTHVYGPYGRQHAAWFSKPKSGEGVYFQHGKRKLYALPTSVRLVRAGAQVVS